MQITDYQDACPRRLEEIVLSYSYLMHGDVPRSVTCDCDLIKEHVLIECGDMAEIRQRYYDAENITHLLKEISLQVFDICRRYTHILIRVE